MDDKITVNTSFLEDLTEQINTLKVQLRDEQMQSKFWEDTHAKLEEKLRMQYDVEFEAFKVSFANRTQGEFEEKINEAAHISASEITSLHKELDKRDESIKNLIRINNNITDEVNNQFNHLAEKHDEIINLTNQLEKSNQQIQRMTMQMMQLQIRLKNQDDPNDGKNSSHETFRRERRMERMKTLEEVCQYVAKEIGYEDWDQVDCIGETMLKKIVQLYGYEQAKKHAFELKAFDDDLNKAIGRANALEEWLTEYRDQLKKENAYHKNTGIINAINELLNDNV